MREVEFYNCQFESLECLECNFGQASFSQCRFEQSEFQGCDLSGLRGLNNLTGVSMAANDLIPLAVALARALGIGLIPDGQS